MRTLVLHKEVWISFIASFLRFIHFTQAQTCTAIDQCSCKLENGKIITLWGIDQRYTIKDSAKATYLYRPCTGLNEPGSDCNGAVGCSVGTKQAVIAYKPTYVNAAFDKGTQRYKFMYTGGTLQMYQTKYKLYVLLICDPNTDAYFSEMLGCQVGSCIVQLTSKCACPGGCTIPKPNPVKHSSRKLSTGSVLCIILLVLVIVYLVAGIAIGKFALHREGSDVVPHKAFWSDVPSLVKDGCIFTYQTIFKGRGDYEQI